MKLSLSKTLKFSISGIRGVYGEDITPENIPILCSVFSNCLPRGVIALARDTRNTSEAMRQLSLGSLISCGRKVLDLGVLPTPTLKNYIASENLAGGLMISASHNPPEYNAFKFITKEGFFFSEKDNQKFLQNLKENQNWKNHKQQGNFENAHEKALNSHIQEVRSKIKLPKKVKMKVGMDTLGACATSIANFFLKEIGIQVFSMYPQLLTTFPRQPEPTTRALSQFSSFVKKNQCDVGFAFDPDADRLAIISSSGKILGEEYTLPLAAMQALNNRDGSMVINLSSSWLNQWVADRFHRKVYRSKVGEAHVVQLMKKVKSKFGGEGNGGVIDMEIPSQGRDSIAGMAWIIALMCNQNQSIDEIVQKMPLTCMKKKKIPIQNKSFLEKLQRKLTNHFPKFKLQTNDGIHLSEKAGLPWVHIRTSNTEPILRVIAEATSQRELQEIFSLLKS